MQLGIDSFAAVRTDDGRSSTPEERANAIEELLTRIELADEVGLDTFGIGEHHRPEYLDSASHILLAAAAARTKNIELLSAVTVLSAADPVRVFQQLASVDLISRGRAGVVVGRGSFSEAFPLFGYSFQDYNELFEEKLDLFLKIRESESVKWEGKFRSSLNGEGIYPRPFADRLQVWLGVGGTPASFVRAGVLGLPLMVAIIGGETHRFRPLIDLYYRAGAEAGYSEDQLQVGVHSLGYVAETSEKAHAEFYPGYARTFTRIGIERGGGAVTPAGYRAQTEATGALVVGSPDEVVEKINRHSEALGGLVRFQLHMNVAELSHNQLSNATRLLGEKVKPALG